MRYRSWLQATLGIARVELRGAMPMLIVLCLAAAGVLFVARWVFQVTPESLLREPLHAWWVLALAGTIPLCAELFGGGGRTVPASTLRPLAVTTSAVLDAKLVVLLMGATVLWASIGAADLVLDTQMARTKVLGDTSARLLMGSAALALVTTALAAATTRSALAAAVVGLMVQTTLGAVLMEPTWSVDYEAGLGLPSVVRSAVYFAVHPVVLCLAGIAVGWCASLRGAPASGTPRGMLRRGLGGAAWAGLATATALGSSAWRTARCEPVDLFDPASQVGWIMPSPDGQRVALNVYGTRWSRYAGATGSYETSYVIDVDSGTVRTAFPPESIAVHVPFGPPNASVRGWSDDGESLWLELAGDVPWIRAGGHVTAEGDWTSCDVRSLPQITIYVGEYTMEDALSRFLGASGPEMQARLDDLPLGGWRAPRATPDVLFGHTREGAIYRADATTGDVRLLDWIPFDRGFSYRLDARGTWLAFRAQKGKDLAWVTHAVTGEVVQLPDGWTSSYYSDSEILMRPRGLLVTRALPDADPVDFLEWGWLKDGAVEPALEGQSIRRVVDLDGERFIAHSQLRGTIELLDASGQLIKPLRTPRSEVQN